MASVAANSSASRRTPPRTTSVGWCTICRAGRATQDERGENALCRRAIAAAGVALLIQMLNRRKRSRRLLQPVGRRSAGSPSKSTAEVWSLGALPLFDERSLQS